MTNAETLQVRIEDAKRKREALGDALEAARKAFETVKELHEQALKEQNDLMAEMVAEMRK